MKKFVYISTAFIILSCGSKRLSENDMQFPADESVETSMAPKAYNADERNYSLKQESLSSASERSANLKTKDYSDAPATENPFTSSAAAIDLNFTGKKFIRKADMNFTTDNVINTTYTIENIVLKHGGYVTNSRITGQNSHIRSVNISKDSVMQISKYTLSSDLILRVPCSNLDTVLKEIAPLVKYMNQRTVTANDVTFSILRNNLTSKRMAKYSQRMSNASDRGVKSANVANIEENIMRGEEQTDNAKISNLMLDDEIAFSTINIYIYQNPITKTELIKNDDFTVSEYKPSFASQIGKSFAVGWNFICEVVILLANVWWLFIIAIAIFAYVRHYRKKQKAKMPL